jgi:hypothetical protein
MTWFIKFEALMIRSNQIWSASYYFLEISAFFFPTGVLHVASEMNSNWRGQQKQHWSASFLLWRYLQSTLDLLDDGFGVCGCGNTQADSVVLFYIHTQCRDTIVKNTCRSSLKLFEKMQNEVETRS